MSYSWDIENPQSYNNRMVYYKTKVEFDFINIYLTEKMKILDIGGGSGRFAIPLHEAGYNVTVVKRDSEAIDMLTNRCPEIRCIKGDFDKVEISQKYDLIISIEVLFILKIGRTSFKEYIVF